MVRTSVIWGSAEGAGSPVYEVRIESGAGSADVLVSEAIETVGVRTGLTHSED